MAVFCDLTLEEMRVMTDIQIATALKTKIDTLNKRQLINLVLHIGKYDLDTDDPVKGATNTVYGSDGQIQSLWTIMEDVLGAKIGSKRTLWTYYSPEHGHNQGPVDTITMQQLDASDQIISQIVVKHYTDGRQPKVLE